MSREIWTVGHSNRDIRTFLDLLHASSLGRLADVRRFPGSRRHPHFNREPVEAALAAEGIAYRHYPDLGGRLHERTPDSPNTAWRVEAFNAYADHLTSPEFRAAFDDLCSGAADTPTAVMCSEALPWQCHRRIITDLLIVRGWTVHDIIGPGKLTKARLTDFARIVDGTPTYPADPLLPHDPTP